jgi:tetratricopeptide (TPR) repeat protein
VTELKNTQSCLFYLLSIFWFLKWEEEPQSRRGGFPTVAGFWSARTSLRPPQEGLAVAASFKSGDMSPRSKTASHSLMLALSLFCFVLATLSKPSVVMLPVVLALCVWWLRRRIGWKDAVPLAPFLVISALASVWTIWEQKFHAAAFGPEWAQTWPERLIVAGRSIWFYVAKLVWPHPLIFIYPRWEIHPSQWMAYVPLLAAVVGLIVLWLLPGKAGRAVFFAAAYYLISLFPVLGFFSVYFFRYSFVSDHFQYLASMGPLALAGAASATLLGRFRGTPLELASDTDALRSSGNNSAVTQTKLFLSSALGSVLLLSLGFLTWRQTVEYRDLVTLYTATLAKNPSCWMAQYNLGIVLSDRGNTDQAISHYRKAVELRPNYAKAHYNLAHLLVGEGKLDDAIVHYEKALEIDPADAEAHNNLGVTLFAIGRVDDAIAHYRKALAVRPNYGEASCNLADALISMGDLDGAIARYSACLRLSPNQAEAHYNLASALLRKGRTDEAIINFQKVLQLRPDSADAHSNLGSALLARGRVRDAMAEYREALRLSPENSAAQSDLAWLLATSSDPSLRNGSEAVALAEKADSESSRGGNRPIVLRILAAAYAEAGRFAEAREAAERALQAAQTQGNSTLANALRDEIALYDLGLPYHK